MGAPISAAFVAAYPEVPVRNFINMAGPIDFSKIGLFGLWLDKRYFNVDRFVDTLGVVPADMVKAGFKSLHEPQPLVEPLERQVRRGLRRPQPVGERVRGVPR
jgi:hypothetical protein